MGRTDISPLTRWGVEAGFGTGFGRGTKDTVRCGSAFGFPLCAQRVIMPPEMQFDDT